MGRKARWGISGCAGIAEKRMLPALLQAQNAELYALASRSREKLDRFSNRFQPQMGYTSYDALLDDAQVDVVYIPLPNTLHRDWVLKACHRGKPVLCEKPLAVSAAQAREIASVSAQTGVPVMEAFAYFHGPLMQKTLEVLGTGRLGRVRYIEGNFSQLMRDAGNVRLNKELGGGASFDMGCYPVSFARAVTGEEPEEVQVMRSMGPTGVDVDVLATLRFPGGAKASMYCSFEAHWCTRNTVLCERGQIDIPSIFDPLDLADKTLTVITKDPRHLEKGEAGVEEYHFDCSANYIRQMEQMGEVALGRAKPAIPLAFSVGNAEVMDMLLGTQCPGM